MSRSRLNLERLREEVDDFDKRWIRIIQNVHDGVGSPAGYWITRVLGILGETVLANQSRMEIRRYLIRVKDLVVANFVSSINDGKSISMVIGDDRVEFTGESTTAYMNVDIWLKGFFAAIVCRDRNAIEIFSSVPEEIFLTADIRPDVFDLAFVRLCKGLFDPSADIAQLLVDAMATCSEENLTKERAEFSWALYLPVVILMQYAVDGDHDGKFNLTYEQALEQHTKCWTNESVGATEGWFSLPLMAAAVLAYDSRELSLENETELVPRWLVEDFEGEGEEQQ